ncbi:MAG: methyltransferase domain-containing protein [Pseudonocardiaceae bacterium]
MGCGAGAASFPLADSAERIIGVDASKEMLVAFAAGADRLGVDHEQICGQWPVVESETPIADVVVCHHVFYNIAAIVPFAQALDGHAQRRVVVEITEQHPQSTLNSMLNASPGQVDSLPKTQPRLSPSPVAGYACPLSATLKWLRCCSRSKNTRSPSWSLSSGQVVVWPVPGEFGTPEGDLVVGFGGWTG